MTAPSSKKCALFLEMIFFAPALLQISDNIVTEGMLASIVGHSRIAPRPGQSHKGRAGVMDLSDGEARSTLHRITAVYGHAGIAWSQDQGKESATEILLAAADEIGRTPAWHRNK